MSAVILIVEDDVASLELAGYLLEHAGHAVYRAQDGQQGLDTARNLHSPPQLILSDIQMPVMDGYQLLAELRRDALLATTPVVAITAFSMSGDKQAILDSGFDGYISKPIDPEQFVSRVEEWLPTNQQSR